MPSVAKRKIIKLGGKNGSNVVALPKPWFNFYKPEEVTLFYEDVILVVPPGIDMDRRRRLIIALKGA